jgi:hypothetical protein
MMLSELEKRAMEMLLAGDDHRLAVLRAQLDSATVTERGYSDSGFFTHFAVQESSPRLSSGAGSLIIDDVNAEIRELKYPIDFTLFVTDGALDMLECVALGGEDWPATATLTRTYYVGPIAPGSPLAAETHARNLSWALSDHALRLSGSRRSGPLA